jgi:phage terminase large subunit
MKTILYGLRYPGCLMGVMAPTYRQMRDSTMREFFKLLPPELIKNFNRSEYELTLTNGTEVLFRSLDNYESVRGIEFAYIWIDEANLVSLKAWQVCLGRLRQPGFPHRSVITTTPRGKKNNWVYQEYVEKPRLNPRLSRVVYHARTRDNIRNIGSEYIEDLEATYTGEFALQELEGQFVDIIEGRVFPQFSYDNHVDFFGEEIFFDPHQPLYGFWDYGVGDEGALWIAQTINTPAHLSIPIMTPQADGEDPKLEQHMVPAGRGLVLLDLILEDGENLDFWVETVEMIEQQWKPFDSHWGDPAGEQRNAVTGKSMAQHLRERKVYVRSKRTPFDEGLLTVHRLLNDRLLFVSSDCEMGVAAINSYHWPLDEDGKRKEGSKYPVHDWASHPCDALRYGAVGTFPVLAPGNFDKRNLNQKQRMASRAPRGSRFAGIRTQDF